MYLINDSMNSLQGINGILGTTYLNWNTDLFSSCSLMKAESPLIKIVKTNELCINYHAINT